MAAKFKIFKRQRGFTLVELIVALAFFSFMLAIVSIGFIQIMRIYQAGVASRRTQQAARSVMEDISREVRAAKSIEVKSGDLCVKGTQTIYYDYDATALTLTKKTYDASCDNPPGGGTVLIGIQGANLGDNLQIRKFDNTLIRDDAGNATSVEVSLKITTGGQDLINNDVCDPTAPGVQFCATTSFTNTVSLRGSSQ